MDHSYEINIDGQTRQAHVDHLKPNPQSGLAEPDTDVDITPTQDDQPTNDLSLTDQAIDDSDSVILYPFLYVDDDTNSEQENVELQQRPQHHCKPTRRLIEEMS